MAESLPFVTSVVAQTSPHLQTFVEGVVVKAVFEGLSRFGSPLTARGITAFRRTFTRASEKTLEDANPPGFVTELLVALVEEGNRSINERLGDELADLWQSSNFQETESGIAQAVGKWESDRQPREQLDGSLPKDEVAKALSSILRNLRETVYRELFAHHYMQVASVDPRDRSQVEGVFVRLQAERRDARNRTQRTAEAEYRSHRLEDLDFRSQTVGEIEAQLKRTRNFVILGEPGSGKSTLLRYLAAVCAIDGQEYLPLFLSLRDYGTRNVGLIAEHVRQFAESELQLVMADGFFDQALSTGRCLVCLDALDEVPADARAQVVHHIEALVRRYPYNRFIITCRTAGYDDTPLDAQDFPRYHVLPMQDQDVMRFINLQFEEGPGHADELRSMLNRNPSIKALASNPLLLTILNLVCRKGGTAALLLNRRAFYERAVQVLIGGGHDDGVAVEAPDSHRPHHEYRLEILCAVAYQLLNLDRQTIGKAELLRVVARFLYDQHEIPVNGPYRARKEAEAFFGWAERRAGLLVELRVGSNEFAFLHPTFQEYLAAQHIHFTNFAREPDAYWDEMNNHIRDERWREVILLLLGSLDEQYCTHLTRMVLRAGNETRSSFRRLPVGLSLAAGALADQATMTQPLQREIVSRLDAVIPRRDPAEHDLNDLLWASADGDLAVHALAEVRHIPEVTIPVLASIASDPRANQYHRIVAAKALGKQGNTAIATTVLVAIANEPSHLHDAKIEAASALAELGERETSVGLLAEIADEPGRYGGERIRAASHLYALGERETAITALTCTANQSRAGVPTRLEASRMLGRFSANAEAVSALNNMVGELERGASDLVHIGRALGDLGERTSAVSILTGIVKDPSTRMVVLIRAAETLATVGQSSEAKTILAGIGANQESDSLHRIWAAETLGAMGEHEAAIAVPIAIVNEPDYEPRDRSRAIRALAKIAQHEAAIPVLDAIVGDPSAGAEVKELVATALAQNRSNSTANGSPSSI